MKLPIPKTALTALLIVLSVPQAFAQTPAKEGEKAGPRPAVAVLDFKVSGGADGLGRDAAGLLRTRLAEGGCPVTDRAALKRALESRKLGMSGPLDRADAAALGRLLAVKNIVVGSVERSGGAYTLDVRFLDAATGETVSGNIITAKDPALCTEIVGNFTKKGFFAGPAAVKADPPARPEPPAPDPAPVKVSTAPPQDPTFEQMLANPDDQDLNYAYAKAQVRKGDLKGAATTLERMLLVNPGLDDIRLFYAVVLFRLDDLGEARREFEAVKASRAPLKTRTEASAYLKEISRRESPTSVSGSLSAGAEYDSNRNASPASQKLLFLDTPLQITGSSRKRDDTAFVLMGNAELKRTLNSPRRHELFASAAYYRADQDRVESLDLQALSFKAGGAYKTAGRAELKPALVYDRVTLGGDKFLVNSGGLLRFENRLNKLTDYWAEARYVYQDYLSVADIASNPQRRGGLYELSAGAGRVLTPVMKLNADLGFTAKRAARDYNSYNGVSLCLRHSWLLGKGMFLLSSAAFGSEVYGEADAMISRKIRKDTTLRAGAVYGLPVGLLHRKLAGLKGLSLSLNLEHFRSNSTVMNYTYVNNKAALLLNYRWEAAL